MEDAYIEFISDDVDDGNVFEGVYSETVSGSAVNYDFDLISENIVSINKNLNLVVILLTILVVYEFMKLRGEKR